MHNRGRAVLLPLLLRTRRRGTAAASARRWAALSTFLAVALVCSRSTAADLALDGTNLVCPTAGANQYSQKVGNACVLGGTWQFGNIALTNGAIVKVNPYDGTNRQTSGNLVLRASGALVVDASSSIVAKGSGYQGRLCRDGAGPMAYPTAGGRGGCAVKDSGGGGAHFGVGGRGTKDCFLYGSPSACEFPNEWE